MVIRKRRSFRDEIYRIMMPLLQFYLFFTSSFDSVFAAQPFAFNYSTLQIYNSPDSPNVYPVIPYYALACPAQSESEEDMNEVESMDRNALFIVQYYRSDRSSDQIACKKNFEMSAVFHRIHRTIEFGYEVYFSEESAPDSIHTSKYTYYGPITEARSWLKKVTNRWLIRGSHPSHDLFSSEALEFTWIPKIQLRYNASNWSFIRSRYTIHGNVAKELMVKCDNHDLGHLFYENKHETFDEFYSPDEQNIIFSAMKIPELPENSVCKKTGECVRKYDFVKPYLFRSSFESPVSCSNLTTIPIWQEVAEELLNNLEIFLFALGQVTENPLTIFPGVYGILSLKAKDSRKSKPMDIYLYPKQKRIPVPKILYKVVRYKSHDCKVRKELCLFSIVIVIHNHPGPVKRHMICPKDKCSEYGWEIIKFVNVSKEGKGSEYIYCCKLDAEMQKKLGYKVVKELHDGFNLNYFPVYDQKLGEIRYVDRQDEIETQMNNLQNEVLEIMKKIV